MECICHMVAVEEEPMRMKKGANKRAMEDPNDQIEDFDKSCLAMKTNPKRRKQRDVAPVSGDAMILHV